MGQVSKGENIQSPDRTTVLVRVLATNFVRAATPNHADHKEIHTWKKPMEGIVKINVDASFHVETLSGSSGAGARDYKGNFIVAVTWVSPHVSNAESAEMSAIRNGLFLAGNIGCNKVIIESDSMLVVEAIMHSNDYLGPGAAVLPECILLAADFENISYYYCRREANQVADFLAKHSFSSSLSDFWDCNIPDFILYQIVNDMSII